MKAGQRCSTAILVLAGTLLPPCFTEIRAADGKPPLGPERVPAAKLREGEILFLSGSRRILPGRSIIGATLRVRDLDSVKRALTKGGIDLATLSGSDRSIFVPPDLGLGMWLEFRAEPKPLR